MDTRAFARTVILASLMTWGAGEANAGLFRTYLSVNGSDANPCTLPSPCRLLPAALAAVNDGGEIWMLDSANFNAAGVYVTQSVTILAVPGALGSVVANGSDGVFINAPGAKVALRNVVILNLSGALNTGINFVQGAQLTLEGCEVYGLNIGVWIEAPGSVTTIKDTTIRDNNSGVVISGAVKALLRNATVINNSYGVIATRGAAVSIAGSAISGSTADGVYLDADASTTVQAAISGSTFTGNMRGLTVGAETAADTAQAMISGVTFSQNGAGVYIFGLTATVFSLGNNAFKFNAADIGLGTLTPLAPQ